MDPLKKILSQLLKSVPQYQQKTQQLEVYDLWPTIVGERTAKHTWPVKLLDGGVLLIAAESSVWLQSLRYLEPQILSKYEAALKKKTVTALRFKMETRHPEHLHR